MVLMAVVWAFWYKAITGSNAKHEHLYGRWRTAPALISNGAAYPNNERFCVKCGWRDFRINLPNIIPPP